MSDEKWMTVSELSESFNIPQPTVRRYIERHGHYLNVRKHHKSYLISEGSLQQLVKIREAYAAGMNADQVEASLAATRTPTIIDVSVSERVSDVSAMTPEALSRLRSDVIERFERQESFNRALLDALEQEREENRKQIETITTENAQLRQELYAARREAAASTEQIRDEIRQGQQEMNAQLGEILSRVETYGKRKKFLGLF